MTKRQKFMALAKKHDLEVEIKKSAWDGRVTEGVVVWTPEGKSFDFGTRQSAHMWFDGDDDWGHALARLEEEVEYSLCDTAFGEDPKRDDKGPEEEEVEASIVDQTSEAYNLGLSALAGKVASGIDGGATYAWMRLIARRTGRTFEDVIDAFSELLAGYGAYEDASSIHRMKTMFRSPTVGDSVKWCDGEDLNMGRVRYVNGEMLDVETSGGRIVPIPASSAELLSV